MYFLLETCQNPTILRVLYFASLFLDIAFVVIPIGLIIMLLVDFSKVVISGKEEDQIKTNKLVVKRIMYAVFIFVTPWMINFVMTIINKVGIDIGGDFNLCINTVKAISAGTDNIEKYDALLEKEEEIEKKKLNERREKEKDISSEGKYATAANEMINLAKGEIGHKGGGKYSGYADSTPWCAFFVVWTISNTNVDGEGTIKQIIEKEKAIYSEGIAGGTISNFYESSNLDFNYSEYYGGNYIPKKGDIIYFRDTADWDKRIGGDMYEETSHVGMVDYVKDGTVYTVEGNISGGYGDGSANNVVGTNEYSLSASNIMGYGSWYK